jgi:hypothetical protein
MTAATETETVTATTSEIENVREIETGNETATGMERGTGTAEAATTAATTDLQARAHIPTTVTADQKATIRDPHTTGTVSAGQLPGEECLAEHREVSLAVEVGCTATT